jgi:hypothetical protein
MSPNIVTIPMQALYLIFPVAAALIALYASRIFGFKSANGRAILLITGGVVCWGIAEVIGFVLDNFLAVDNLIPRVDSFFFLLAYPIFGAGIYQCFITSGVKLKQVKKTLLAIVVSISIILTTLVGYFGIYQAYDPSVDLLTNIVNIGYGIGDLILIVLSLLTILVASEYKGGKLASFWKIMTAGFFVFLIADTLFFTMWGDLVVEGTKPYAVIVEMLWVASYQLLTYGLLENYVHISSVQKSIKLKLSQK